jgi:hypothetical protein
MINLMRIHSLEGFINQAPETGITSDSISGWEKGADSEARERTIQAFQSALANLNGSIFNSSEVSMDELQSTPMLTINDLKVSFNVYVQHADPNFEFSSESEVACSQSIDAFPAIAAPVSVTAQFNPNVAYAVHLKAFVKKRGILYLPNTEDLELDAYAGAKPFGSRIGPVNPPAAAKDFVKPLTPGTTLVGPITPAGGAAGNNVPYLQIDNSTDFYSTSFFTALNAIAKTGATSFTGPSIAAGQIQAIAPWMKEVGHYSIIPPLPTTATDAGSIHAAMAYDFIPYANPPDASGNNIYRFYAPIFPNSGSDITSTISNMIDSIFGKVQVGTSSNRFNFSTYNMGQSLKTQIKTYIDSLSAGGTVGENGETQTFAAIELPMPTTLKPGPFWLTKANQVLSSWGPSAVRESSADAFGFKPRFAYSVKFVTMQDLQSQGIGSEDDSDLSAVVH